jgi:hypothetical protein
MKLWKTSDLMNPLFYERWVEQIALVALPAPSVG